MQDDKSYKNITIDHLQRDFETATIILNRNHEYFVTYYEYMHNYYLYKGMIHIKI